VVDEEESKKKSQARLNLYLDQSVLDDLNAWADRQGRSATSLGSFIVAEAIRKAKEAAAQKAATKKFTEENPIDLFK
jgi:hypothetical protein